MATQTQSTAMGAATGAATGAAMGTMIAPGVGTAIGAGAGLILGGLQGSMSGSAEKKQKALLEAQQEAIRQEGIRRDKNVGKVRDIYGALPTQGEKYRDVGKALENQSSISGAIGEQASAVRSAGQTNLTNSAQAAGASLRGSMASRGLLGSSLDDSNRQRLLGSYLGGKANLATGVADVRQGARDSLKQEQLGLEGAMLQGGDISGQISGMARVGAVNQARSALPYRAMGSLMGDTMGFVTEGAKAYQQGGQGLESIGMYQPRLGGSMPGAYQPKKGM